MEETAADYLDMRLHFGLTNTTYLVSALLIGALVMQFRARRYVPWIYWLVILFTFALGTAGGDLVSEDYKLGYVLTAILCGAIIAAITIACWRFNLDAILAFWTAIESSGPRSAST